MDERYCFSANDVALYLLTSEMPLQRSNSVMHDLFDSHNHELREEYRADFRNFRSAVQNSIALLSIDSENYDEIKQINQELNLSVFDSEQKDEIGLFSLIEKNSLLFSESKKQRTNPEQMLQLFFKHIRLCLLYSGTEYRRIKLRTLMRVFGYRRRSEQLMNRIHEAMNALELQAFLKGYEPCDLSDIPIDRMVSIRLQDK